MEDFLAEFDGVLRLFPLPDLVLFPHVVQPLRIFEPRYVELFEDAMRLDQRLTMCLLQAGWESHYDDAPAIVGTGCLGRILTHQRQSDGSYHFLLAGVSRVRILQEMEVPTRYRQARGEIVRDVYRDPLQQGSAHLRQRLLDTFQRSQPQGITSAPAIQKLLHEQIPLGVLTDVMAFAAAIAAADKQRLLEDPFVERRAALLISLLQSMESLTDGGFTRFPPAFSDN